MESTDYTGQGEPCTRCGVRLAGHRLSQDSPCCYYCDIRPTSGNLTRSSTCMHFDTIARMLYRKVNASVEIRDVCRDCGGAWGGLKLVDNPDWRTLPVWKDNLGEAIPCARCGTRETEQHHWAPRAMFDDADQWPMSPLCVACHTRWHRTIDTGRGQVAS